MLVFNVIYSYIKVCFLASVNCWTFLVLIYYTPEPVIYLELPYYGPRRVKDWLDDEYGLVVNRKRIQPLRRLLAIETLYPKRNLSLANWRVSTTMDAGFCTDSLEEAIENYGCPEIFNTDQGSQFTSEELTGGLKAHDIVISMDGEG